MNGSVGFVFYHRQSIRMQFKVNCFPRFQPDEEASSQSALDADVDSTSYPDWKSPSLQSEEDASSIITSGANTPHELQVTTVVFFQTVDFF